MKRLKKMGEQPPLFRDSLQSDIRGLLKTGVFSLLLHIFLILLLILNLKTGMTKGGFPVYRVTIRPFPPQNNSTMYPLRELPAQQPVPVKTQIQKKEEIKQEEPIQEPKQPLQQPIPLPMASTSSLNMGSNLEKEDNLTSPPVPSPEEENKNAIPELGLGEGPGTGIGGPISGGSADGKGTGQDGSRWGGPGEGMGRGNSGWAGSGKGSGMEKKGHRGILGVGQSGVSSPGYAENPKPVYPQEARNKGYQGDVLLKVEVLSNGRVGEIEVEKSSGYEMLDQSALTTVKKWRFIPARKGGTAIPCWVTIPFKFQLRDVSF
jgi:TonB family protein